MASGKVVGEREVVFTAQETQIFELLRSMPAATEPRTVVRVAGGWVRDKLLGRDSHDIDLALDNMTGADFAPALNEHLRSSAHDTHRVSVIQANPDQSKHLETATVKVCGQQIDLVNLRAEEYADGSRIPAMRFGTPTQDALRRDFTINALFYNVNEGVFEDFTGRGFSDLEASVLRTPMEPAETLRDDPLRVLRAVRFAARYGFRLATDLRAAIDTPAVRADFARKVSRERVGAEVDGMLTSSRPAGALRTLHERGVLPAVLALPPCVSRADADGAAAVIRAAAAAKHGRKGAVAPDAAALAAAEALMGDTAAAADASPEHVAAVERGMGVVDAAEAVAAAAAAAAVAAGGPEGHEAGGAASATAGGAEAGGAAASGSSAAEAEAGSERRPVKVMRCDGMGEADAERAASISAEAHERGVTAPEMQAQELEDRSKGLAALGTAGRRVLLLSALLWPLRDAWAIAADGKDRGKATPASGVVLRGSLRLRLKDCADVLAIHEAVRMLQTAAREACAAGWIDEADVTALGAPAAGPAGAAAAASSSSGGDAEAGDADMDAQAASAKAITHEERACLALGLAVRRAKDLVPAALALAAAVATDAACPARAAGVDGLRARLNAMEGPAAAAWGAASRLEALVESKGLSLCWKRRPVVDGRALRGLGLRPGPAMRPVMEAQALWQLAHPRAPDEECRAAVEAAVAAASE